MEKWKETPEQVIRCGRFLKSGWTPKGPHWEVWKWDGSWASLGETDWFNPLVIITFFWGCVGTVAKENIVTCQWSNTKKDQKKKKNNNTNLGFGSIYFFSILFYHFFKILGFYQLHNMGIEKQIHVRAVVMWELHCSSALIFIHLQNRVKQEKNILKIS